MPLVTDPLEVEEIYAEAREKGMALAGFCTESPEGTEAILKATSEMAREYGIKNPPAIVSSTGNYRPSPQLRFYTAAGNALVGFKALVSDVETLVSPGSPYENVRVMLHLDHAQPDIDGELLVPEVMKKFATIMFDCSYYPMEENIKRTARFVEESRAIVRVEGAVDEIFEAGTGMAKNIQTDPDVAERFVRETGVFLIVPNVGTEHRAAREEAKYNSALARQISARVGKMLVLHGSSSLFPEDLPKLKDDGVIKVNIWTILGRMGSQGVAEGIIRELGNILDEKQIRALQKEGYLGQRYFEPEVIKEAYGGYLGPKFAAIHEYVRRDAWMERVIAQMKMYFEKFGYQALA
ncbi:MAG: class II fructose-bisphosphate aldolase [Anaerolineae bacterium]